jgi:hypothetical protein
MPSKLLVISVRLKKPLYDLVAALAGAEGRSMSNYVESIVKEKLESAKPKRA